MNLLLLLRGVLLMDTRINQQSFLQCLDELEAESSDNYLELYRQEYERDKQAQIEKAASAITTAAPAMLSSI
jgi:hypothetical protein